jgi:hypothetical protein
MAYLDENYGGADGQQAVEFDEGLIFVLIRIAIHIDLPDAFHGEFLVFQGDLVGVWRKLVRITDDVLGESGGE